MRVYTHTYKLNGQNLLSCLRRPTNRGQFESKANELFLLVRLFILLESYSPLFAWIWRMNNQIWIIFVFYGLYKENRITRLCWDVNLTSALLKEKFRPLRAPVLKILSKLLEIKSYIFPPRWSILFDYLYNCILSFRLYFIQTILY